MRAIALLLVLLVAIAVLQGPAPAGAAEPPAELGLLCFDKPDRLYQVESPSNCKKSETLVRLPEDRPVHLCAYPSTGKLRLVPDPNSCHRDHEVPFTVTDSGPFFMCSKNVSSRGAILPRGELRWTADPSGCQTRWETPYVTPGHPISADDAYTVDEDSLLQVPARGVLENDSDYTGGTLRARLLTQPSVGTVQLSADGAVQYDPRGRFDDLDVDQSRTVTFTYLTSDGKLDSEAATVAITVTGRNDPPVAVADTSVTTEDTALFVVAPGVLGNDSDAENHVLRTELTQPPSAGVLTLGNDGSVHYDPSGRFDHLKAGQDATVSFRYIARDGTSASGETEATITITGVNDAPRGVADHFTTDENTPIDITPAQLVDNDTDAEDEALTIEEVSAGNPSSAFTRLADGTVRFDPRTDFDHLEDGQTGTASFTYRASDGAARSPATNVTIEVGGRSTPVATDDLATTNEDQRVAIDLFANDRVAGSALTILTDGTVGTVRDLGGGVVEYDPAGNFDHLAPGETGSDRFTYELANDEGTSRRATVRILIEGREDPPVAHPDQFGIDPGAPTTRQGGDGVLFNDLDPDTPRSGLTARLVAPPERGRLTLQPDGGFGFDPSGELVEGESVTFRYRAADATSESASSLVTLAVGQDFPPLVQDATFTVANTAQAGSVVGQVEATDPEGQPLTYAFSPPSPHFVIDPGTGAITLTTNGPPLGTYHLSVVVTDVQRQQTTGSVVIRVRVPFVPTDDVYRTVGNTTLLAGPTAPGTADVAVRVADGVLANDGAAETLEAVPASGLTAQGGTFDLRVDGSFSYEPPRPDPGTPRSGDPCDPSGSDGVRTWDGTLTTQPDGSRWFEDTFTYTVIDGDGGAETRSVALRIEAVAWYVDSAATGAGCGTSAEPYASPAPLSGGGDDDDAGGQTIFLFGGPSGQPARPAYGSGIDLEPGQELLGEAAGLTLADVHLVAEGQAPVLQPASGRAIGLAADNTVRGLVVDSAGSGLIGSAVGALVVDVPSVKSTGGPALNLAGGDVAVDIETVDATSGAGEAVRLEGLDGEVSLGTVNAAAPGDTAFAVHDLQGGDAVVRVTDLTVSGANGLAVDGNAGGVQIGSLAGEVDDVAVAITGNTGLVSLGSVVTQGGESGLVIDGNTATGNIVVDSATVEDPASRALSVTGNSGVVHVRGGTLRADPADFAGVLLDVVASAGQFSNRAAVRLEPPAGGGSARAGGRSVNVSDLTGTATVLIDGPVVDRGTGIRVRGNEDGTAVRFAGGMDVSTGPTAAFHASNTPLEVVGAGNRLRSEGAAALRLFAVRTGAAGATFVDATSVEPGFEAGSTDRTGYGVDIAGVQPGGSSGTVVVGGGQVTRPARGGARVLSSSDVTLGGLQIVEPQRSDTVGGHGVDLSATRRVLLSGTRVERSGGDGIVSDGDAQLVLDRVTVSGSRGRGVVLDTPTEQVTLRSTTIRTSAGVQLQVLDERTVPDPSVVQLEGVIVDGSTPEVAGMLVEAKDQADLTLRVAGDNPSASFGGLHGLQARALDGGRMQVDVSRFGTAANDGDGISLSAAGTNDDRASDLTFALADLTGAGGGGVQLAKTAGIRIRGNGPARAHGTIARAEINGSRDVGLLVERTSGVQVDRLTVNGPEQTGVAIHNARNVSFSNLEITGAPQSHALELWGARNVSVTGSRIDLRQLQPPPTDEDDPPRAVTRAADHCTTDWNAQETDDFVRGDRDRLYANGSAGVFARHVGGTITIADTTVRGATHHQMVVVNGGHFPTFADPAPRPTPTVSTAGAKLVLSGLQVRDVPDMRAGVLAGAADGSRLEIEFGDGQMTNEAPIVACATEGGHVTGPPAADGTPTAGVRGSPSILATTSTPAIELKAADNPEPFFLPGGGLPPPKRGSTLLYALQDVRVEYAEGTPPRTGSSIAILAEHPHPTLGAIIHGTITNTTVIDAPGTAMDLEGVEDRVIEGLTAVRPRGPGLTITSSRRVDVLDLAVEDAAATGVVIRDSDDVGVVGATIVRPRGAGFDIADSSVISLTDVDVDGPQASAVDARTVSGLALSGGDLDASGAPTPDPVRSAVRARNVLPLTVSDSTLQGFTGHQLDAVNGTTFPGEAMPDLACDTPPCTGAVTLGGLAISGTSTGDDAVFVGAGPGASTTVDLAGAPSDLDAPLAVLAADGSADVTGGPTLAYRGSGDALRLTSSPPGDLTVDVADAAIAFHPPSGATPASGIAVDGASSTRIVRSSVDDPGRHGISVAHGPAAVLEDVTVNRAAQAGLLLQTIDVVDIVNAAVVAGLSDAIVVDDARSVEVTGSQVEGLGDGISIDGATRSGQCTVMTGNDVTGAAGFGFALDRTGLSGFRDDAHPAETVAQWLTRNGNAFASERNSDVHPC